MCNYLIRNPTQEDYKKLRTFYAEVWARTYSEIFPPDILSRMISDLNDPGLTGFLPGTDGAAILAEKNCEIAGAAMGADRAGTGYLWGMYVRRDHQRLGLGSAILAELVRQLPDAGRFEVRVLVESPWALNFYRKHGFSELGRELLQFTEGYCRNVTLMAVSRRRIESSLQAIV